MRSWPVVAYAVLYAVALLALVRFEGLDPTEPLFVLATFGVGMSGLAWWATRGLVPRPAPVRAPRREAAAVLLYLFLLSGLITWGLPAVRGLAPAGWSSELLVLLAKTIAFLVIPWLAWRHLLGYRDLALFDLRLGLEGHWRPALVMTIAVIAFQLAFGRAGRELSALHPAPATLALALCGSFAWLLLDVGFIEEVPFRGLCQTRLAAWAGSEAAGLVAAALCFGLAHAPGLYLRPGLTGEAVGGHPSLLRAVGSSIVVTSVSGLMYGVLWLRTRNLWVVAIVHAAQDLLPTAVDALRQGFPGA